MITDKGSLWDDEGVKLRVTRSSCRRSSRSCGSRYVVGVGWAVGEVCRGTGLQVKYVEVLDIEEGANR